MEPKAIAAIAAKRASFTISNSIADRIEESEHSYVHEPHGEAEAKREARREDDGIGEAAERAYIMTIKEIAEGIEEGDAGHEIEHARAYGYRGGAVGGEEEAGATQESGDERTDKKDDPAIDMAGSHHLLQAESDGRSHKDNNHSHGVATENTTERSVGQGCEQEREPGGLLIGTDDVLKAVASHLKRKVIVGHMPAELTQFRVERETDRSGANGSEIRKHIVAPLLPHGDMDVAWSDEDFHSLTESGCHAPEVKLEPQTRGGTSQEGNGIIGKKETHLF